MSLDETLKFIKKLDEIAFRSSEYIVKHDIKSGFEEYGYYPHERPIEMHMRLGIVNLDKPPGPTSHEVAAWVKRILGLTKVGHAGTLEFSERSQRVRSTSYSSRRCCENS
ncbi:MAG: tRNA pseudouridine synthase A [Sulfolobales archaeon]